MLCVGKSCSLYNNAQIVERADHFEFVLKLYVVLFCRLCMFDLSEVGTHVLEGQDHHFQ
jgi:hypothetical protein